VPKDTRAIQGDILIDDDPQAIDYARSTGRKAILIRPYQKGQKADPKEVAALYAHIRRATGFWGQTR